MTAVATVPMPTIEAQRASVATWASAPDPLKLRGLDPKQVDYVNKLISSQQRIAMIKPQPVTIVNLNPYDLVVLHPLFAGLKVKATKDGDHYSALVISDVKYQVDQGLDHNHTPVEFWPIQLATEFATQYRDKGGVFHIDGNLEKNPELANTAEFKAKYEECQEQMFGWCRRLKAQADGEWATPNRAGARNIHAPHRMAVKILLAHRLISKMPEWMDDNPASLQEVVAECPTCGAEPKKMATMCPGCARVLDPIRAFQNGDIDEYNLCFERLTRAQVRELGISAFVAETIDEKPARLERGEQKPFSAFEAQQMAAQEQGN